VRALALAHELRSEILEPMKRTFVGKDEIIDLLGLCLVARENRPDTDSVTAHVPATKSKIQSSSPRMFAIAATAVMISLTCSSLS
jgi:hypothetical protein